MTSFKEQLIQFKEINARSQQMAGLIEDISRTYQQIDSAYLEFLQTQIQQAKKELSSPQIRSLAESAVDFIKSYETSRKLEERFAKILFSINWPPIWELTERQMQIVVDEYEKRSFADLAGFKKEMETDLLDYFDKEMLLGKLSFWEKNAKLAQRITILRKVMEAHIGNNYFMSVPVTLAQVDGILHESFCHKGKSNTQSTMKYVEQLYQDNKLRSFSDALRKYLSTEILDGFKWGSPITSAFVEVQLYSPVGTRFIPHFFL